MKKLIIACSIVLLQLLPYAFREEANADTLSGIRTKVREITRDTSTDDDINKFDSSTINSWINEGMLDTVKRTDCVIKRATINTSTGTREYSLASDFLEEKRVWIVNEDSTNTYRRIAFNTLDGLDKSLISWEDASNGQPICYYIRPSTFSTVYIGLYPEPDGGHTGTGYLRYDYIPKLSDMSSDSDVPFNGILHMYPYHDLLTSYAVYRALRSVEWYQVYLSRVQDLEKDLNIHTDKVIRLKLK